LWISNTMYCTWNMKMKDDNFYVNGGYDGGTQSTEGLWVSAM